MPSATFERNAAKVLDVLDRVPAGFCTTYGDVGAVVGIVPRYVALIMASAPEVHTAAWHRVVGADATVKPGGHKAEQKRRLQAEGITFDGDRILDFQNRRFAF